MITPNGIYTSESARWRALLGLAEVESGFVPTQEVEDHLVRLCLAYTEAVRGQPIDHMFDGLIELVATGRTDRRRLAEVGDQALVMCGLFPEFTERMVGPLELVTALGSGAYRACVSQSELQAELGKEFLTIVDLLQSLREIDMPIDLDPMTAVSLWNCSLSANSLRRATRSLGLVAPGPVSLGPLSNSVH